MATRKKKTAGPTPVEATEHTEARRLNIPTAELESFAREAEREPKKLLYPRDPSLDPQLAWKGKDDQDSHPLEVPAVPIYIQETIEPRSLIEDLRAYAKAGKDVEEQTSFFDSYEGLEFGEKVDFYQHASKWANRMILGDSLLVMASLAEKEGLKGQVQMIYLDPPYGIRFGSNWQVSTRSTVVKDGSSEAATRQPEQVRAFRDTWELGIHSYLAYLRDRLTVAHDLLAESGSMFVQIGDANVHLVRLLLDEVFGSRNFVSMISFNKSSGLGAVLLPTANDYILWYARDIDSLKYRQLYRTKSGGAGTIGRYNNLMLADGTTRPATPEEREGQVPEGARLFTFSDLTKPGPGSQYEVEFGGQKYRPEPRWWGFTPEGFERLKLAGRIAKTGRGISYLRFLEDFPAFFLNNVWTDIGGIMSRSDPKVYVVQTSTRAIANCLLMTTDPGDLVLDPTCGAGTTAYVAEEWGRRWITVDTSRVALALARTRLMTARFPYFLLADSAEGALKEAELTGRPPESAGEHHSADIGRGFVYERLPRVTLKSIVNNPDLRDGMGRDDVAIAIARHADTELLIDRPVEASAVVRVTGPVTIESLSPHRVIGGSAENHPTATPAIPKDNSLFVDHIIGNLLKAGVQNTVRGQREE